MITTLLALSACTKEPGGFRDLVPILSLSPESVQFGDVGKDLEATELVVIENAGNRDLFVEGGLADRPGFTLPQAAGDASIDAEIAPGELLEIPITFRPTTFREYESSLVLTSNDENQEGTVHRVAIRGKGVDLPLPDLEVRPSRTQTIDELEPGATDQFLVELVNVGDAPLSVGAMALDGPIEFSSSPELGLGPVTISPGDSAYVFVDYDPSDEEGETATLHVFSDDPDEPEALVTLVGNGGGDFEFPVAVIDCPPSVELLGPIQLELDGTGSYDPAGLEPLTYKWLLVERPLSSDASYGIDPDYLPTADLRVDTAGTWTVALTVANQLGAQSEPAVCQFAAIPEDDIHVELTWADATGDVDLHLRQAGVDLFDDPGDANYCNQNPGWADAGSDDDPRLDIDDLGGLGPENINIFAPADGAYDVAVHYFGPDASASPTVATVRIWIEGALVFDGAQALRYNEVWEVGRITWPPAPPASPFAASSDPVDTATRRGCPNP